MNYLSAAEELLGASSAARGLGAMEHTAALKGPNAFDGGAASKVQVNTQPYNNARLQEQNKIQNVGAALPQAQSSQVQALRKQRLISDNAEYKANAFRDQRKGEVMEILGSPATMAMSQMTDPEMNKLRQDMAIGKAMAIGINPDLAQNQMGVG